MFKNVTLYRIAPGWAPDPARLEERLQAARFAPCAATQPMSGGWTEPRGVAHAPLAERIDGQWLLDFMSEQKVLPGAVVKRKVDERARAIEAETGRKPGKKQAKELREEIVFELLPQAFTRQSKTRVWIDAEAGTLLVGAGSGSRADEVVSALVQAADGLAVLPLHTATSPAAAMAHWLASREAPAGFSVDRECELRAADESKAVVRYARHTLDIEEVGRHIAEGKLPTRLALTWDGRVSFVLTDTLQLKRIDFLDVVFEGSTGSADEGFDSDAAITTGELRRLLPALVDALGGESLPGGADEAPTPVPASTGAAPAPAAASGGQVHSRRIAGEASEAPF